MPLAARSPSASTLPGATNFTFWSPTQQEIGYRSMEKIFPTNRIARGAKISPLQKAGQEVAVDFTFNDRPYTVDDFMKINRVSGVMIVRNGKILLERYGLGREPDDRWTSFSIAKSVTSTLIGAAIKDGKIKSIDDPLTAYLPDLKGGAYDGVSIRQALTMTSGVKWDENYDDPNSDFSRHATEMGPDFIRLMAKLPRDGTPGTKYKYSTGESNILGAVVLAATGKTMSAYLSEKIWVPYGMEQDAVWMTSPTGEETGGICFSATLRDYARFGMFFMEGGVVNGEVILPEGWIADATRRHSGTDELEYGYQWWVHTKDRAYEGIGIMGQSLYIHPDSKTIVVIQSAWPQAGSKALYDLQIAFKAAALKAAQNYNLAGS